MVDGSFVLSVCLYSLGTMALGVLSSYFIAKISAIIRRKLTQSLSERILEAKFEFIEKISERIVPILTREVSSIVRFINDSPQFIISVTTVVVVLAKLFFLNYKITALFLVVFCITSSYYRCADSLFEKECTREY